MFELWSRLNNIQQDQSKSSQIPLLNIAQRIPSHTRLSSLHLSKNQSYLNQVIKPYSIAKRNSDTLAVKPIARSKQPKPLIKYLPPLEDV